MAGLEPCAVRLVGGRVVEIEHREDLSRGNRHKGLEIIGDNAQTFDRVDQDLSDARHLRRIFREREGRRRRDIFVGGVERLPDRFQRAIHRKIIDQRADPFR